MKLQLVKHVFITITNCENRAMYIRNLPECVREAYLTKQHTKLKSALNCILDRSIPANIFQPNIYLAKEHSCTDKHISTQSLYISYEWKYTNKSSPIFKILNPLAPLAPVTANMSKDTKEKGGRENVHKINLHYIND